MTGKPSESIFRQVLFGGLWTLGLRLSSRALGFVRTVVLARLLFPADFGLIAMAMLFVTGLESVTQTGLQQALIQKKTDIRECLDTAWTVTLARSLVLCLVLVAAAPFVAGFFAAPRLTDIIRVVSLSVLIGGAANIGIVYFQRDLEFGRQFRFETWASVAEFALTVLLAFALRDVWALVWGGLAGNVLRVLLSYALHPFRPSFRFDPAAFLEMLNFGKWVSGYAVLCYAVSQCDSILLGRMLGAESLGYYQMAFLTAVIPSSEVAIAFSMVAFPSYSMMQDQPGRLRESFEKVFQVSALVCMPIGMGILAVAPDFIRVVLGERWQAIAPIMQVLSIMGVAKALEGTTSALLMAVGRPGLLMGFSSLQLALLGVTLYPLTLHWGITGAALAVTLTALAAVASALAAAVGIAGATVSRILALLAVPAGASAAMAVGITLLKGMTGPVTLPGFLLLVAAGIGLYAACVSAADALLTSGSYRGLVAALLAGLRTSGKNAGASPAGGAEERAAALGSDDPWRWTVRRNPADLERFLHFPSLCEGELDMTSGVQVSVILPYYEGERWIGRSVASVLGQAGVPLELIIVEDGSAIPDGTADGPLSDPRVRRFRIPHAGKGAALNFGAGRARADLLCFIDQDDIMMPGRLQRQIRAMRSDGTADAVYSDYERVFDDGRLIDRFVSRQASAGECLRAMATDLALVTMQTIMIRRDVFRRVGGFSEDPLLTGLDDAEFFARLFVSGARLRYEPGVVQQWVRHDRNYSQSGPFQEARLVLIAHLRGLAECHPQIAGVLGRFTHDVHYMRGIYFLENDRKEEALPEFLQAVRSYPLSANTYYLLLKSLILFVAAASAGRAGVTGARGDTPRYPKR